VIGFDEAIARANAALAVGADVAFVEAPQTLEELAAVPKLVKGPCLLNIVRRGKTPAIELKDAEAMGYKLAILPTLLFRGVIGCCEELLAEVKKGNFPAPPKDLSPHEAFARFGAAKWDDLRERYRGGADALSKARVAKAG
jgi:2-methylisocitrate lyase-like PEP mutase family enzyme